MNSCTRGFVTAAAMSVVAGFAGEVLATGLTNTWTGAANDGDWSNPQNFSNTSFAPGADDVVAIDADHPATIDASSASWARMNALRQVFPKAKDARLVITVPETVSVIDNCPFTSRNVSTGTGSGQIGLMVKKGLGTLELGATEKCVNGTSSFSFCSRFSVEEGTLMLPQHGGNRNFAYEGFDVAEGATLYTAAQNGTAKVSGDYAYTTVYTGLTGQGVIASQADGAPLRLSGSCVMDFSGKMTGGIRLMLAPGARANLSGTESDFYSSNAIQPEGYTTLSIAKFGRSNLAGGDPSSMGTNTKFEVNSNDRIVYTGSGEKMFKSMIVRTSPFFFDAGAVGGLDVDGSEWSGYYGSKVNPSQMQHLVLDGSNTSVSVFHPYVRHWNDQITPDVKNTFYISKRGTGTWWLKMNQYSEWRGGTGAEDGTLQFDTIAPVGTRCSFGLATDLYEPYCGPKDDAHKVSYALRLGGNGTTGTVEYIGKDLAYCEDRPTAIYSSGRLVNSGGRRLYLKGFSGLGAGEKELILDGTADQADQIDDITDGTDGAKVSVVKRGTGAWTLGGTQTFGGDLRVEGGTLMVQDMKRYNWFKWTVRQVEGKESTSIDTGHGYAIRVWEFGLFDEDGKRCNVNLAVKEDHTAGVLTNEMDRASLPLNAASMGRHLDKYETGDRAKDVHYDNEGYQLDKLFDDSVSTVNWYPMACGSLMLSREDLWISVYMHIANPAKSIASYDFIPQQDGTTADGHGYSPTCWTMYGSFDGREWVELDAQDHVPLPKTKAWSHANADGSHDAFVKGGAHKGYPLAQSAATAPDVLTKVRSVYVAPGAKLVAGGELTIGSLKTDKAGMGRIEGFTFAEDGVFDITDPTKRQTDEVPFDFADAEGIENVSNWTVMSNGKAVCRKVTVRDGKFIISPTGLSVIIR